MKKTICDRCERKRFCNTFDRSRGMACVDYKKKVGAKNADSR